MILDTNVLITAVSPRCPERLTRRLAEAPGHLYTTAVNWAEICHGLSHLAPEEARRVRRRYIGLAGPPLQILHFDQAAAEVFGWLRPLLEQAGQRLDDLDLIVASIALRHDLTLVTGNTRHFSRVPGLRLENWLTEE